MCERCDGMGIVINERKAAEYCGCAIGQRLREAHKAGAKEHERRRRKKTPHSRYDFKSEAAGDAGENDDECPF